MLSKLLKHEFAATARFMWIIYAAMAGLSLFANLSIHMMDRPGVPGVIRALMTLLLVLWVFSLIAGMIATVVLMVMRFHRNLLTDEGYLMFTLPTDVHRLVIAKLLTAVVWLVASMIMIALCVCVAVMSTQFLRDGMEALQGILKVLSSRYAFSAVIIFAELIVMLFLGVAGACLKFYSAMSIGYGFSGHKVLWSVIFYFAQSTVLRILGTVFMVAVANSPFWPNYDFLTTDGQMLWHLGVLAACGIELIIGAVFYVLTTWNLKNRLNLS